MAVMSWQINYCLLYGRTDPLLRQYQYLLILQLHLSWEPVPRVCSLVHHKHPAGKDLSPRPRAAPPWGSLKGKAAAFPSPAGEGPGVGSLRHIPVPR